MTRCQRQSEYSLNVESKLPFGFSGVLEATAADVSHFCTTLRVRRRAHAQRWASNRGWATISLVGLLLEGGYYSKVGV